MGKEERRGEREGGEVQFVGKRGGINEMDRETLRRSN